MVLEFLTIDFATINLPSCFCTLKFSQPFYDLSVIIDKIKFNCTPKFFFSFSKIRDFTFIFLFLFFKRLPFTLGFINNIRGTFYVSMVKIVTVYSSQIFFYT